MPTNPSEIYDKATEPDATQLWSFALLAAERPDCSSPTPDDNNGSGAMGYHFEVLSLLFATFMLYVARLF